MNKPVTAIIVGAGHRSLIYSRYAVAHPERLRIVGVADPDPERRRMAQELFALPDDMLFEDAAALAARGRLADAVINGTMDQQHVETAVPLLAAGYDMLLEKPFALNERELRTLVDAVRRYDRKVMICHVLRYAPFYAEIRRRLPQLGKIQAIETTEHVSHHHMLVAYVRGKWRNTAMAGHHSMLLAKCCHDIDLIMWMKSGVAPVRVASFGGMQQFRPENAPAGATIQGLVSDTKAETGATCTVKQATADYTVQVKLIGADGAVLAESEVETVRVNTGFFAKLIAFFKGLFGSLPVIAQRAF